MIPNFEILGRTFAIYPILSLIGIFTAGIYACRTAKKRGFDDNNMIVFLLVCAVGVLLGMHLLYGVTQLPLLEKLLQNPGLIDSWQSFLDFAVTIFGGSVFYGGLLGGIAAGYLYGKKKGLDLAAWSDMAAPVAPLFHTFGRIGCFLGGCCYGVECTVGFTYQHSPIPEANGVTRFPIQLVEAAWNLLLFLLLSRLLKTGRLKGRLFCTYLLLYAPARFVFEFWRGDTLRGAWLGLSTSQWVSLLVIAGALWVLFRLRGRPGLPSPAKAEDSPSELRS